MNLPNGPLNTNYTIAIGSYKLNLNKTAVQVAACSVAVACIVGAGTYYQAEIVAFLKPIAKYVIENTTVDASVDFGLKIKDIAVSGGTYCLAEIVVLLKPIAEYIMAMDPLKAGVLVGIIALGIAKRVLALGIGRLLLIAMPILAIGAWAYQAQIVAALKPIAEYAINNTSNPIDQFTVDALVDGLKVKDFAVSAFDQAQVVDFVKSIVRYLMDKAAIEPFKAGVLVGIVALDALAIVRKVLALGIGGSVAILFLLGMPMVEMLCYFSHHFSENWLRRFAVPVAAAPAPAAVPVEEKKKVD